jgi:arylsulfatase A-like enzyme
MIKWFLMLTFFLGSSVAAERKPNLIFILTDDLGYGDLGCYGQKTIQTPHLDQLAKEGMRFTQFYAGSTVCGPSRCCLMTGKHTGHARIRGNADVSLTKSDVTFTSLLKPIGYQNAVIGKWGMGEAGDDGIPTKHGFDYFFGYLNHQHAHNYYTNFLWKNETKFPLANEITPIGRGEGSGVAKERKVYTQDLFAADTLRWVREQKDRPFFLYLSITLPHANNENKPDGMEIPDYGRYSDKEWPNPEKGRAAMITRMDSDVGELLALLKELKLEENTVVMFSSDNGPHREGGSNPEFHQSSGPYRGLKRDLYDGGIRVPLIARWPGKIAPGSTSDRLCANWDIFPTLAEISGFTVPRDLDGISLLPTLTGGKPAKEHSHLYWEFYEGNKAAQAVRTPAWKGIWFLKQQVFELYASTDVAEQNNVASAHPEVVASLRELMKSSRTASSKPEWNP